MRRRLRNYLFKLLLTIIVIGVAVSVINRIVDPYGLWAAPVLPGINDQKVVQATQARLFKAATIMRLKPEVIFLGTSRTEFGMDPSYLALPGPAYNLGINGANLDEIRAYLAHAIYNNPHLQRVFLGLDLFSFAATTNVGIRTGFDPGRLQRESLPLTDYVASLLSLDALQASVDTIRASRSGEALAPYNTLGSQTAAVRRIELRRVSMQDKMRESMGIYLNNPNRLHGFELSGSAMDDLRNIVRLAKSKGITLTAYFSPTHVAHMEVLHARGLDSVYENWKRQIVDLIGDVWDFSGYNSVTSEPIGSAMHNFWDVSHYRQGVGHWMIDRMLGRENPQLPQDFGVLMSRENLAERLQASQQDAIRWRSQDRLIRHWIASDIVRP